MGFGFLSSMGFLYNRGTPDVSIRLHISLCCTRESRAMESSVVTVPPHAQIRRDDMGNPGESRPANYGALGASRRVREATACGSRCAAARGARQAKRSGCAPSAAAWASP